MTYEPPQKRLCDFYDYWTPLDEFGLHGVGWESWSYSRRVVRFALRQQYRVAMDAEWQFVYRADTKYGEVHDHRHSRGVEEARYRTLEVIPDQGWDVVNKWFEILVDELFARADERLERWTRGR